MKSARDSSSSPGSIWIRRIWGFEVSRGEKMEPFELSVMLYCCLRLFSLFVHFVERVLVRWNLEGGYDLVMS
jgi:hypothetical protein